MDVCFDSAWKNSINAAIGSVGMLLSARVIKSLNSTEKSHLIIMCATFNDNFCITIVSCYNPTNAKNESDITIFIIFNPSVMLPKSTYTGAARIPSGGFPFLHRCYLWNVVIFILYIWYYYFKNIFTLPSECCNLLVNNLTQITTFPARDPRWAWEIQCSKG